MAMALHVATDDRTVQNVERGKQRRRCVALVVMVKVPAPPFFRQAGLGTVKCSAKRRFRLAGSSHDLVLTQPVGAEQNDLVRQTCVWKRFGRRL